MKYLTIVLIALMLCACNNESSESSEPVGSIKSQGLDDDGCLISDISGIDLSYTVSGTKQTAEVSGINNRLSAAENTEICTLKVSGSNHYIDFSNVVLIKNIDISGTDNTLLICQDLLASAVIDTSGSTTILNSCP